MTEIEKKAEEWFKNNIGVLDSYYLYPSNNEELIKKAYKDGYEQGQKDFDTDVTKILNSYGVTFIDTNSIGGLIGLHQIMLDLEKENEELKAQIEKMKQTCIDVMKVQANCLSNDYMAGMYNGMVVIYNYCFLDEKNELEKDFCSKNKNKWELEK